METANHVTAIADAQGTMLPDMSTVLESDEAVAMGPKTLQTHWSEGSIVAFDVEFTRRGKTATELLWDFLVANKATWLDLRDKADAGTITNAESKELLWLNAKYAEMGGRIYKSTFVED